MMWYCIISSTENGVFGYCGMVRFLHVYMEKGRREELLCVLD